MNREEIIRLARKSGMQGMLTDVVTSLEELERFAALVEQHLVKQGYRKCAEGQRTTQFCGMLEAAAKAEREECAKICDGLWTASEAAEAIRARK